MATSSSFKRQVRPLAVLVLTFVTGLSPARGDEAAEAIHRVQDLNEELALRLERMGGAPQCGTSEGYVPRPMDCSVRYRYLTDALERRMDVGTFLDRIAARRPSVIFLGETHDHFAGIRSYAATLRRLRRRLPDLDCVFLESGPDAQEDFDAYLSGNAPYEQTVGAYFQRRRSFDYDGSAHRELFEEARARRVRVIAVDRAHSPGDDVTLESILERNRHMADRIDERIRSGQCRRALMPVGSLHLTLRLPSTAGGAEIPFLLRRRGIQVASIRMEMTHPEARRFSRAWVREDCSWNPQLPHETFAFETPPAAFGPTPEYEPAASDGAMSVPFDRFDGVIWVPWN